MDVSLTSEQQDLIAAVTLLADRSAVTSGSQVGLPAEGALTSPGMPMDSVAWSRLLEMDLLGLRVPEQHGGAGAGTFDVALVAEQLARRLVPVPYLGTVLALDLLIAAGSSEVTALVTGARSGGVVVSEDLADVAAAGVVWDAGPGAYAVGVQQDRVVAVGLGERLPAIDLTRGVFATNADISEVGAIDEQSLVRWRAGALALCAADLVGTLTGAIEAALAHVRVREQFGRPVGSFQALQHLLADQHLLVEAARSVMWHASWAVDALPAHEAHQAAVVANAFCSSIARDVAEAALQAAGGIGMTWEAVPHLYLRRALLGRRVFGDEEAQLHAVAADRLRRTA
jgi:alkylation response protein AidB-like acyl-CoA dehydrogenase